MSTTRAANDFAFAFDSRSSPYSESAAPQPAAFTTIASTSLNASTFLAASFRPVSGSPL